MDFREKQVRVEYKLSEGVGRLYEYISVTPTTQEVRRMVRIINGVLEKVGKETTPQEVHRRDPNQNIDPAEIRTILRVFPTREECESSGFVNYFLDEIGRVDGPQKVLEYKAVVGKLYELLYGK